VIRARWFTDASETDQRTASRTALLRRYELGRRLEQRGLSFEWASIRRALDRLQQIDIRIDQKHYRLRTETRGLLAKLFPACGIALLPTLQAA